MKNLYRINHRTQIRADDKLEKTIIDAVAAGKDVKKNTHANSNKIAFSGSINDVRQSLNNGANVNEMNHRNETPLHIAAATSRGNR